MTLTRRITSVLVLLTLSTTLAAPSARPGEVRGTVLDAQGKPIPGAIIWIKPGVTTGLVSAKTDAGGQYRVTSLPKMPYFATA